MMRSTILALAAACLAMPLAAVAPGVAAAPFEGTVRPGDWSAYRDRFVGDDGRVVDDLNGGISHSEGQGYGLLLAYSAGDRVAFERIWTFTSNELLIRDDGLAAWKWDPNARPHLVDVNNASDGDLLVAYALALAGEAWGEPRYVEAARRLADALGKHLLVRANGRTVLLPGAVGFSADRAPGAALIVNPSYWVFEAFPVLERLAPDYPWTALATSGVELIAGSRFGPAELPADWVAVTPSGLRPAEGFPSVFGYNAIRIPLYLVRAGATDGPLLAPFVRAARSAGPGVVDLASGRVVEPLNDPGYRMLDAAVECAAGTAIPEELKSFRPTHYYPSTLYLLAMSYVLEKQPGCL